MKKANLSYDDKMHRMGRIWTAIMIVVMIFIPFGMSIIFKTLPDFGNPAFWAVFIPVLLQDLPSGIGELVAYAPILGTGGTYLAFITGNLSNLKIPCVMNARKLTGVEIGTKESEIVSTISIASSAITTTVVLAIGVLLITPLTPILESELLKPAFKTVVSAMFGALGYHYAKDNPRAAIIPLVLGIVIYLIAPGLTTSVPIMVFVIAAISLIASFLLYKKGIIK